MSTEYAITKEACEASIPVNNVCERCGRKPVPLETVNNSDVPTFWAGCRHGSTDSGNFTMGIDKDLRELAKKMVLDDTSYLSISMYDYLDYGFEYWFEESMYKACSIIRNLEGLEKRKPSFTKAELRKRFSVSKKWRDKK